MTKETEKPICLELALAKLEEVSVQRQESEREMKKEKKNEEEATCSQLAVTILKERDSATSFPFSHPARYYLRTYVRLYYGIAYISIAN